MDTLTPVAGKPRQYAVTWNDIYGQGTNRAVIEFTNTWFPEENPGCIKVRLLEDHAHGIYESLEFWMWITTNDTGKKVLGSGLVCPEYEMPHVAIDVGTSLLDFRSFAKSWSKVVANYRGGGNGPLTHAYWDYCLKNHYKDFSNITEVEQFDGEDKNIYLKKIFGN